jgi:hypothetical protein
MKWRGFLRGEAEQFDASGARSDGTEIEHSLDFVRPAM